MTNNNPVDDLEQWAVALQARSQRFGELGNRLGATFATESSPGGVVRVTVDSNGVQRTRNGSRAARGGA